MNFELLQQKSQQAGLEAIELDESVSRQKTMRVYEGAIDNYSTSSIKSICLRGLMDGKVGTTYTEKDDDSCIDEVLHQLIENRQVIETEEESLFNQQKFDYETLNLNQEIYEQLDVDLMKSTLLETEAKLHQADARIKVNSIEMEAMESEHQLENSYGLFAKQSQALGFLSCEVVISEGEQQKTHFDYAAFRSLDELNTENFVAKIVQEVQAKLNGEKAISKRYPVILQNKAMTSILGALSGSFSAVSVQKEISVYKDKLGEMIMNEALTIVDDPTYLQGLSATAFDDEGSKTYKKNVVENGRLMTYLHNLKTAKKAGVTTTGNGFKPSRASDVDVSVTNFYIQPGETSFDDLVSSIEEGVLITDLQGLHAGMNPLTTDFSLQAQGFMIEQGKITRPLHLITVAGNIREMLQQQVKVADDFVMRMSLGSPSVYFEQLQVTGE